MKPGWRTSEFWLSTMAQLLGWLLAAGILVDGHWGLKAAGAIVAMLSAMGYTNGRSKLKAYGVSTVVPTKKK